jgi:hypothetical protein
MSEVNSNSKDYSKRVKDNKLEQKKSLNKNITKSDLKKKSIISANIQKLNSKESKNSINDKLKHLENEKANLSAREKTELNKLTSPENKSFSEKDISEYDDEWRNLNELVKNYEKN